VTLSRRHQGKEHPSASHSQWGGGLKFVVTPEIARHPDQPDRWKVSGIERDFASKEHAEKVRNFLKHDPPDEVKKHLVAGTQVDHLLPGHLAKLPRWNDVHGVEAKKESIMRDRIRQMYHLIGECREDCGCKAEKPADEAIRVKGLRSKKARDSVAQDISMMRRTAGHGGWPERSAMRDLIKLSGGTGKRYEAIRIQPDDASDAASMSRGSEREKRDLAAQTVRSLRHNAKSDLNPNVRGQARDTIRQVVKRSGGTGGRYKSESENLSVETVYSSIFEAGHVSRLEAVTEQLREAMECGCIDKIEDARDALRLAMLEAGCPPMQHFNKKTGGCAKLTPELHAAVQGAHQQSIRSKKPEDHFKAHQAMSDVAKDLQKSGFHQLGNLHAARAHQHKVAASN